MEFLAKYGLEIVCTLIAAGALALCRAFNKRLKEYKSVVDAQEQARLETFVEKRLDPIYQELEDLRKYIRESEAKRDHNMDFIIASYRFRLIQLCKEHLAAKQMTSGEYEQLTEFYKLYTSLGGNGQAKEYYDRTIQLPIVN